MAGRLHEADNVLDEGHDMKFYAEFLGGLLGCFNLEEGTRKDNGFHMDSLRAQDADRELAIQSAGKEVERADWFRGFFGSGHSWISLSASMP